MCSPIGAAGFGRVVMFHLGKEIINKLNKLELSFSPPVLELDGSSQPGITHASLIDHITIEVDDEQIDVKCAETQDHKGLLEIHLPKSLLEQLRTSFGVELFVTFARPEKDWIVKKDITQLKLIWA